MFISLNYICVRATSRQPISLPTTSRFNGPNELFAACWLKIRPSHGLRSWLSPSLAYGPDELFFGPQGPTPFYAKVSAVKILDFEKETIQVVHMLLSLRLPIHTLVIAATMLQSRVHPPIQCQFQVYEPEIYAVFLT